MIVTILVCGFIVLGLWGIYDVIKSNKGLLDEIEEKQEKIRRMTQPTNNLGDAHFANFYELQAAGLLDDEGMTLGGGFKATWEDGSSKRLTLRSKYRTKTSTSPGNRPGGEAS